MVFSSDASESWGCGAIWATNWIQCEWQATMGRQEYSPQRAMANCLSLCNTGWGASWSHKRIQVLCDNAVVIEIINAKTTKCRDIMHLLRCLHFFLAYHGCTLQAVHVPGVLNVAADAISRNHMQVLHQTVPNAQLQPDQVLQALWKLLVLTQPD